MTRRVPAQEQRYPPLCPDPDYCVGNNMCFWDCEADPDAGIEPGPEPSPKQCSEHTSEQSR
jgi:hypothetical protein